MQRAVLLVPAVAVLAACDTAPTEVAPTDVGRPNFRAVTFTDNIRIPIDEADQEDPFVPCANGGAGESLDLSGTLHLVFHVTVDNNDIAHVKLHFQPQGVIGIGLVTGDTYRATGVTQSRTKFAGELPINDTFINNFRMIGQGQASNFHVHETIHVTINANGEVTADVENVRATCK